MQRNATQSQRVTLAALAHARDLRQVTYKMPAWYKINDLPQGTNRKVLGGMEKFEKLCIMCSHAFDDARNGLGSSSLVGFLQ